MCEIVDLLNSRKFKTALRRALPRVSEIDGLLGRTWERWCESGPRTGDPMGWLLRVAQNIARDDLRAENRRVRKQVVVVSGTGSSKSIAWDDLANVNGRQLHEKLAHRCDPIERLLRRERRHAIAAAVRAAGLGRDQGCALWAWMRNGLRQWADTRRIPYATARTWVNRALKAIKPHAQRLGLASEKEKTT